LRAMSREDEYRARTRIGQDTSGGHVFVRAAGSEGAQAIRQLTRVGRGDGRSVDQMGPAQCSVCPTSGIERRRSVRPTRPSRLTAVCRNAARDAADNGYS
jgi:hypothetical protein